jgi:hypothetical protein
MALHDMSYGGLFADTTWEPRRTWSHNRKDERRAMQRVVRDRDLGGAALGVDTFEAFFHNLFGSRGSVSEAELATTPVRDELTRLDQRLHKKLSDGGFGAGKVPEVVAFDARFHRDVLQRYPETEAELRTWMTLAEQYRHEIRRYLGLPWEILVGAGAGLAVVAGALYWAWPKFKRWM